MFAWSRTWYAKRDDEYFNFEMKKQRDDACKNYCFIKVSAKEAYEHYPYTQVCWRRYDDFIKEYRHENSID